MIQFPNGFTVKCIGGYGKSSIYDLFIHYYNCIKIEDEEKIPNVIIVLTEKGYKTKISEFSKTLDFKNLKESILLLGPQTKEELESLKLCGIPLYTVAMNKVYTMYKHLHFPIYDYINVGLVLGAYKISKSIEMIRELPKENEVNLLNLKDSYISIEIEKNFSLRYSMMNENVRFIYESGTSEIGVLLCMEWVKSLMECNLTELYSVYTIFDIDEEDLQGKDLLDFLIPFTILGNLQKGFLIVNSDIERNSESSESLGHSPRPEAFDFSLYNTLKGIWNSKEYIPRRKKLAEPLPDYEMFRNEKSQMNHLKNSSIPNFEECIRKPPIFIIDKLDSIKEWIKEHVEYFPDNKQIFVYVKKI
jgi:hypothetical protein